MHDIKLIRDNPEAFEAALRRRSQSYSGIAQKLIDIDKERRETQTLLDELKSRKNAISKEIGIAKSKKDEALANELLKKADIERAINDTLEAKLSSLETKLKDELSRLPNLPFDEVPDGVDEKSNELAKNKDGTPRQFGLIRSFSYPPKEHFDLGESLGYMDFASGVKLAGARFTVLRSQLARLERALGQFMLDLHTTEFGYTEMQPPMLVNDATAFGTGQLPKFGDDLFRTINYSSVRDELTRIHDDFTQQGKTILSDMDDWFKVLEREVFLKSNEVLNDPRFRYWLIPTAEVPLTNLARDLIIDEAELPWRFTALTACFRSEAGAAGRDTRGMIRQHQFNKVELVSIVAPEKSVEEHERMTEAAETVLKRLELPFRTMLLCAGDMGGAARKTYDLEVWLPGQDQYREISSCSNCGDWQARRMNARCRVPGEKQTRFVHTLNGSGLAVGRALIAVMENYQNEDGSISVPDALRPYTGGLTKIEKAGK